LDLHKKSANSTTTNYWLVDDDRNLYFLKLKNKEEMQNECTFLLGFKNELIVVHLPSRANSIISIKYLPEHCNSQLNEIQKIILKAFEIGGYFCSGINDEVVDAVLANFD
jgi:hypothetical protein